MHWPADLDPRRLRQPDSRTCGAASVLMARAMVSDWHPQGGPNGTAEILDEHRHLTSSRSPRDRFQFPWPRALGTPPWAVANALTALTGERIATVNARPRPAIGFDVLREQALHRPVGVYIGSRWLPRHVVLAVRVVDDGAGRKGGIEVFDPAMGRLITVPADHWCEHRVGVAGWDHFWFVV